LGMRVFWRILGTKSASVRRQLLARAALAIFAAVICVTAAGVLAARQEAGQQVDQRADAAKSAFDQSLALRSARAHGAAARNRAESKAVRDASGATGAQVTLGGAGGPGRVHTYPLRDGRSLTVVVATTPVANATRSALLMGLGVGAGVMLVVLSLL